MKKIKPLPSWAKTLRRKASQRAKAKGYSFSLTEEDMQVLVAAADGRCTISKIPFVPSEFPRATLKTYIRNPYAPSIDRINCGLGYELENCRLVCSAVNYALGDWGDEVLKRIAFGICGVHPSGTVDTKQRIIGLPGVRVCRRKKGTVYSSRFYHKGLGDFYGGTFNTELEAHLHTVKLKEAFERGEDMTRYLPVIKKRFPQESPESIIK